MERQIARVKFAGDQPYFASLVDFVVMNGHLCAVIRKDGDKQYKAINADYIEYEEVSNVRAEAGHVSGVRESGEPVSAGTDNSGAGGEPDQAVQPSKGVVRGSKKKV
jgi:hypothetical protein